MAITRVSPEEAKKLIDESGYQYVDVRSEIEYDAGHPGGACNVPLMHAGPGGMQPNPRFVEVMEKLFPKDAKIVLGCRSGQRSLRAAEMLVAVGYTNIVDQRAGYEGARNSFGGVSEQGWAGSGLPTELATPEGKYSDLLQRFSA